MTDEYTAHQTDTIDTLNYWADQIIEATMQHVQENPNHLLTLPIEIVYAHIRCANAAITTARKDLRRYDKATTQSDIDHSSRSCLANLTAAYNNLDAAHAQLQTTGWKNTTEDTP